MFNYKLSISKLNTNIWCALNHRLVTLEFSGFVQMWVFTIHCHARWSLHWNCWQKFRVRDSWLIIGDRTRIRIAHVRVFKGGWRKFISAANHSHSSVTIVPGGGDSLRSSIHNIAGSCTHVCNCGKKERSNWIFGRYRGQQVREGKIHFYKPLASYD